MTTNFTSAENKTIEETAYEIGLAVGMSAEKARTVMMAFGEGIRKGIEDSRPLEAKVGDAKEAVLKGVKESTDILSKTAEAFGDGVKKGIDDAKPLKVKVEEVGDALVKSVAEGVDNLAKDIEAEKDKIEAF
jgi:hypothetical protein